MKKLTYFESDFAGKTEMHGNCKDPTPFSGMGYRLGGGDGVLSEKNTNASSSTASSEAHGSLHHSAVRTTPIPKKEIKLEKSPHGSIFSLRTNGASEKSSLALKREFPKLSAADTEDDENDWGLPARMARVAEGTSSQGSPVGKRAMPSSSWSPKRVCLEQTPRAQNASEKKSLECANTLQQWPKKEDKTAFEKYFSKKGGTDVTTTTKPRAEFTQSSASPSNPVRQERRVSCPVCETDVLESEINEHLDSCLS